MIGFQTCHQGHKWIGARVRRVFLGVAAGNGTITGWLPAVLEGEKMASKFLLYRIDTHALFWALSLLCRLTPRCGMLCTMMVMKRT